MSGKARSLLIALTVLIGTGTSLRLFGWGGIAVYATSFGLAMIIYNLLEDRRALKPETIAPEIDRAAVLRATPPPGSALLFISRTGIVGKAITMDLLLDGTLVAQLRSPRFSSTVMTAGTHILTSTSDMGNVYARKLSSTIQFTAAAGETVIIELGFQAGAQKPNSAFTQNKAVADALSKLTAVPMIAPQFASAIRTHLGGAACEELTPDLDISESHGTG